MPPNDLPSLIALRRAQLVDLLAMHDDGHTGAAEGIERIRAELRTLGVDDDAPPADTVPPATP